MSELMLDDLFDLVDEIKCGAKDKTRTIDDISDFTIRDLVSNESDIAISNGVTSALLASGASVSAVLGALGCIGSGAVSVGINSLAVSAAAAGSAALTGAALGNATIPILGGIAGFVICGAIAAAVTHNAEEELANQKESLRQEVLKQQNTVIKDLEKELAELKKKYGEAVKQNKRYQYIIGILMANEELKQAA